MKRAHASLAAIALVAVACGARVEPLAQDQTGGTAGFTTGGTAGFTTGGTTGLTTGGTTGLGTTGATAGTTGTTGGILPQCQSGGATDVGVFQNEIKIGAVISRTGPLPGQFNAAEQALDAYFKTLNSQGGICGRRIRFIVYNDNGDTVNNRDFTRRLVETDKVFALVGSHSANDGGMAGVLCPDPDGDGKPNTIGVPDIGFALDWNHAECPTTYGVPGLLQRRWIGEGASGSKYLNRANNITRIAIFWLGDSEVSILSAWAFEAAMLRTKPDIRICYEQQTSVFERGFRQFVQNLKDRCPAGQTAVYTTMENSSNILLAKEMGRQGYRPKVYAPTFTSYLSSFIDDAEGFTEGAYIAMPQIPFERCTERNGKPVPPCSHPELQRYVEAVNRFHPTADRPGSFGAPAWGQAGLFIEAAKRCGSVLTRRCVLDFLERGPAFSAGGFITPNRPGTHKIYTADLLVQVRNGRFVEVTPPPGARGPAGGPDFWDTSVLFDWWKFYCANKEKFPNQEQKDDYIRC